MMAFLVFDSKPEFPVQQSSIFCAPNQENNALSVENLESYHVAELW